MNFINDKVMSQCQKYGHNETSSVYVGHLNMISPCDLGLSEDDLLREEVYCGLFFSNKEKVSFDSEITVLQILLCTWES